MEQSRGILLRPRTLVVRELDSLAFDAVVLRGTALAEGSGWVDLAYLDDGNIERCIPVEELSSPTSNSSSLSECAESEDPALAARELEDDALWECLLQRLITNDAEEPKEPTTPSAAVSEVDCFVIEDGTVILNGAFSALPSDQVLEEGKTVRPVGGQESLAARDVPATAAAAAGEAELVAQHLEVIAEDDDEQSNSGSSHSKEGQEGKAVAADASISAVEYARSLPACRVGLRGIRSLRVRRRHGKGPLTVPMTPR